MITKRVREEVLAAWAKPIEGEDTMTRELRMNVFGMLYLLHRHINQLEQQIDTLTTQLDAAESELDTLPSRKEPITR